MRVGSEYEGELGRDDCVVQCNQASCRSQDKSGAGWGRAGPGKVIQRVAADGPPVGVGKASRRLSG